MESGPQSELELVFADVCPRCRSEHARSLYVSGEMACRACTGAWIDGDELVDKDGRVWMYWPFPSDFVEKASCGVIEVECPRCASNGDGACDCDAGAYEEALDAAYLNGKARLRRPGYHVTNEYVTPMSVGVNMALMRRDGLELKVVVDSRIGDTAAERRARAAIRDASEPRRKPARHLRSEVHAMVRLVRTAFDATHRSIGDDCADERAALESASHIMERAIQVLEANERSIGELIARVQIRFERVVQERSGDGEQGKE